MKQRIVKKSKNKKKLFCQQSSDHEEENQTKIYVILVRVDIQKK